MLPFAWRLGGAAWTLGLALGCASPVASSNRAELRPSPRVAPDALGSETAPRLTIPGTYTTGARCVGTGEAEVSLTLYPDSLFVLRHTHRDSACGEQVSVLYLGRWTMSPDLSVITLRGEVASPRRFTVVNQQTLRMVDEPASGAAQVRRTGRVARLVPFCEPLRLRSVSSPICAAGS